MPTSSWVLMAVVLLSGACDSREDSDDGAALPQAVCTDDGLELVRRTLRASADGVHVEVTNATGDEVRLVASPVQENPTLTITPGTATVVVLIPPGEATLRCDDGRPDGISRPVTVTVEDPHGFYRSVDLTEALGCEPDTSVDLHDAAWGPTPDAAADAYAAQVQAGVDGDVEITRGNGYRDHDRHEFLLFVDGQGYGTVNAYRDVHPEHGHRYRASYGQMCMERAFPDRGPGAG